MGDGRVGETAEGARGALTLWGGLSLVLVPMLARMTTTLSIFPGWEMDPLVMGDLRSGLTPRGSVLADVVGLVGAALLFAHARGMGARVSRAAMLLSGIGSVGVVLHALVLGGGSVGDARVGFAWMSAIVSATAVWHAGVDARVKRVVMAVLMGALMLMAVQGAQELFVAHPAQVKSYQENMQRVLASHGWNAGSPMAKGFERRLMQPEASGWFGLSNVYASMMAAGSVFFAALGVELARRRGGWRTVLVAGAGLAACGAGVYFSQSKGGVIACAAGVVAASGLWLLGAFRKLNGRRAVAELVGGALGIGAVVGAVALIFVRGIVGERIGELSILFRWFYVQASARIFSAWPLFGVGPDGFQGAYASAKNPLSPEEVNSPHSIVFDYAATLGVFGIAWVCLVLRGAWAAGRGGVTRQSGEGDEGGVRAISRAEVRGVVFIPAAATLVATAVQGVLVTPELALVRLIGLVAWAGMAYGILKLVSGRSVGAVPICAAGLALLAHAQIDVTGSWSQSCGWVAMVCACAAACGRVGDSACGEGKATSHSGSRWMMWGVVCSLAFAVCGSLAFARVHRWESRLFAGVDALAPLLDMQRRLDLQHEAQMLGRTPAEPFQSIVSDLGRLLSAEPAKNEAEFRRMLIELETRLLPKAIDALIGADAIDRSDSRARKEASRVAVRLAADLHTLGRESQAQEAAARAVRVLSLDDPLRLSEARGGEFLALSLVHEFRAQTFKDDTALRDAATAIEHAMERDPYSLDLGVRRFRLAQKMGDTDGARRWAERCIELDGLMKYDKEVRGLSVEDREAILAAIKG